jgi:hypothetical protein
MATTWTATSKDFCRPFRGPVRLRNYPEGPSQTFKKGIPVRLSGTSTNENQVLQIGAGATVILGVAAEDASGTTNTHIAVWLAEPGVEFKARLASGQTSLFSLVTQKFGGTIDTSNNIFRIDTSTTTGLQVDITAIGAANGTDLLLDPVNDINAYVGFEFTSAARSVYKG